MTILEAIEKYFPDGELFTAHELSMRCGIDTKVLAMNLKRLSNSYRIGHYSEKNSYYDWGVEGCNKARQKHNDLVDKHNLKQKKMKLIVE